MKKSVGMMGMILGGLCLSLEIYLLDVLQGLDKVKGEWYTSAWSYTGEAPCLLAFAVTAIVIGLSVYAFVKGE